MVHSSSPAFWNSSRYPKIFPLPVSVGGCHDNVTDSLVKSMACRLIGGPGLTGDAGQKATLSGCTGQQQEHPSLGRNLLIGSLAKTGLDGGLGSPAPTSFSALTLNSYSQPCRSSVTQYSTFGWIFSVLQRTHLSTRNENSLSTGGKSQKP